MTKPTLTEHISEIKKLRKSVEKELQTIADLAWKATNVPFTVSKDGTQVISDGYEGLVERRANFLDALRLSGLDKFGEFMVVDEDMRFIITNPASAKFRKALVEAAAFKDMVNDLSKDVVEQPTSKSEQTRLFASYVEKNDKLLRPNSNSSARTR